MADRKLSASSAVATLGGTDIFYVGQGGTTKKLDYATLVTALATNFEAAGYVDIVVSGYCRRSNNLSDVTNAATARTNLGLVIGTNVQAYDAELAALAGLTSAADKLPYFTGSGTASLADLSSFGRSLIDDAAASNGRTTLGVAIGSDVQAYHAALANFVATMPNATANQMLACSGANSLSLQTLTALAQTLLSDSTTAAWRSDLGLVIGTNVQAYDAELAAIAGLTSAANKGITFTGSGTAAVYDLSAAALTVLDDSTVAAMLATMGGAPLASPTLTGTPLSTTAAVDTNTTQIATTAYVIAQAASATPIIDGTGAVGTSTRYARADHVHPTDTTRAPLASPTLTGTPAAPTATLGTNTTQIATTAFVLANSASSTYTVVEPAAAGTNQGNATALTAKAFNWVTGATGGEGVKLPAAAAGSWCMVFNFPSSASAALHLYPASGDRIYGGGTDYGVDADQTLAAFTTRLFVARDATSWVEIG